MKLLNKEPEIRIEHHCVHGGSGGDKSGARVMEEMTAMGGNGSAVA